MLDYDQAPTTQRCLRSVAAGTRRPDEIVLVENGERSVDLQSDGALAELGTRVLHPGANIGAAGGRNLALNYLVRNSSVERFVLLDNDTVVPEEFIELVAARSLASLEIAAPLVLDMNSEDVIYAGGRFEGGRIPHILENCPEGVVDSWEVDWAPTVALVFDRDTWMRVGGFDQWYEFLWEDVEWCHRAVGLGAAIRVIPQLRVRHEAHQSSGGFFSPERVRQWSRNGTVFLFQTVEVSWATRLKWIAAELRRAAHEVRLGWTPIALGRLRGVAQGLREVGRRRFRQAGT